MGLGPIPNHSAPRPRQQMRCRRILARGPMISWRNASASRWGTAWFFTLRSNCHLENALSPPRRRRGRQPGSRTNGFRGRNWAELLNNVKRIVFPKPSRRIGSMWSAAACRRFPKREQAPALHKSRLTPDRDGPAAGSRLVAALTRVEIVSAWVLTWVVFAPLRGADCRRTIHGIRTKGKSGSAFSERG
jgi:hypothetical protein